MDEKQIMQIDTYGDVSVVSFGQDIVTGLLGLEQINERLRVYISDRKPGKLIVDFDGVKFFSSQVLGMLVDIWRRLRDYGGIMLISGVNPQLNRVFKITNLDKIFEFYPDRAHAVEAMRKKK
ncbi:MAG TPA: STAS domain-containing protein [Planctomycetes bacterium]|nr:STAS domain-containing protein [Planctomycetota bacterium]